MEAQVRVVTKIFMEGKIQCVPRQSQPWRPAFSTTAVGYMSNVMGRQ